MIVVMMKRVAESANVARGRSLKISQRRGFKKRMKVCPANREERSYPRHLYHPAKNPILTEKTYVLRGE
jgi:hypothetical protein